MSSRHRPAFPVRGRARPPVRFGRCHLPDFGGAGPVLGEGVWAGIAAHRRVVRLRAGWRFGPRHLRIDTFIDGRRFGVQWHGSDGPNICVRLRKDRCTETGLVRRRGGRAGRIFGGTHDRKNCPQREVASGSVQSRISGAFGLASGRIQKPEARGTRGSASKGLRCVDRGYCRRMRIFPSKSSQQRLFGVLWGDARRFEMSRGTRFIFARLSQGLPARMVA